MKYLLLLSTLTLSLMFSSTSSAEWTNYGDIGGEVTLYLDEQSIRKNDGYVYAWMLIDFITPMEDGVMSAKIYREIDCKAFRFKTLTFIFYKQPMGEGEGDSQTSQNQEWQYPPHAGDDETMLNKVCAQ